VSFEEARNRRFDTVADALEAHLDMETVYALVKAAAS
jgi:cobyric acid synthase